MSKEREEGGGALVVFGCFGGKEGCGCGFASIRTPMIAVHTYHTHRPDRGQACGCGWAFGGSWGERDFVIDV